MYKLIKLPDLFSLLNLFCGLASIYNSYIGKFNAAAVFLLLCVLFDGIDGKIARLIKREGNFGKQLDSLSDIISFGVAPSMFGYALLNQVTNNIFLTITFFVFIAAGVLRLARYNISKKQDYFRGIPITTNGILIPLLYFLRFPLNYFVYVYIVLAVLMVSPFKIKKIDIRLNKNKEDKL